MDNSCHFQYNEVNKKTYKIFVFAWDNVHSSITSTKDSELNPLWSLR